MLVPRSGLPGRRASPCSRDQDQYAQASRFPRSAPEPSPCDVTWLGTPRLAAATRPRGSSRLPRLGGIAMASRRAVSAASPRPLRAEDWQGGGHPVQDAAQVHVNHLVPVGELTRFKRRVDGHARDARQHVETSEPPCVARSTRPRQVLRIWVEPSTCRYPAWPPSATAGRRRRGEAPGRAGSPTRRLAHREPPGGLARESRRRCCARPRYRLPLPGLSPPVASPGRPPTTPVLSPSAAAAWRISRYAPQRPSLRMTGEADITRRPFARARERLTLPSVTNARQSASTAETWVSSPLRPAVESAAGYPARKYTRQREAPVQRTSVYSLRSSCTTLVL